MMTSGALVERHDAVAAKIEIMLQANVQVLDLRGRSRAAQLPRQLVASRKPDCPERIPPRGLL
jgi:hypothetical protein